MNLKRYYQHRFGDMVEAEDNRGNYQWVKAEDAETLEAELTRLKELNREMYEALNHLLAYRDSIVPDSVFDMAEEALQKARGEEEMNIRECVWCGKAIYGDDYYYDEYVYYHKDCQMKGMSNHQGEEREYCYQKGYTDGFKDGMNKYLEFVVKGYEKSLTSIIIECPLKTARLKELNQEGEGR